GRGVRTGPGRNWKDRSFGLWSDPPVTSLGGRAGGHWTRRKSARIERASARASIVLPTPGTSSMSTWPRASSAATTVSTAARLPSTTRSTLSTSRAASGLSAIRASGPPDPVEGGGERRPDRIGSGAAGRRARADGLVGIEDRFEAGGDRGRVGGQGPGGDLAQRGAGLLRLGDQRADEAVRLAERHAFPGERHRQAGGHQVLAAGG